MGLRNIGLMESNKRLNDPIVDNDVYYAKYMVTNQLINEVISTTNFLYACEYNREYMLNIVKQK